MPHNSYITQLHPDTDLSAIHALEPELFPYLLQSVAHANSNSNFDILFALPGEMLVLNEIDSLSGPHSQDGNHFLASFDHWFNQEKQPGTNNSALPFTGGWFMFLGYELAQQIEPSLNLPLKRRTKLPVAFAVRSPAAILQNHETGEILAVAETQEELDQLVHNIEEVEGTLSVLQDDIADVTEADENIYKDSIKKILQYIKDGDVFQVNLSRPWSARALNELNVPELYYSLCTNNPAPFAASVQYGQESILSSSPERLVSVRNQVVETRPIAGTRRRARSDDGSISQEEDEALLQELIKHPKERAEHVMLIDLERNDLGRVCKPGSVNVNELMVVESYEHVHHIVSNVKGELRPEVTPGQVLAAVFPGGTITGCPKVRCMEIIAELEQEPREAYTGSLGYINLNGDMDFNILIRTIQVSGNDIYFRAGGGIVFDSDPDMEVEETRSKAKGLLNALAGPVWKV